MRVYLTLNTGVTGIIKDDQIKIVVSGVTNYISKKPSDSFKVYSTTGVDSQLIHSMTTGITLTNVNLGRIVQMTGTPMANFLDE